MFEELCQEFTTVYGFEHLCPLCGQVKEVECRPAICDELAEDWQLSTELRRAFDYREGCACRHCGATVRIMNFSLTLLEIVNLKVASGYQFVRDIEWGAMADLKIAEVNNCGVLHGHLANFNGLAYSEYCSENPEISSEDLMGLSYKDEEFDIVLTSDVLEHVPDYHRAMAEIKRVLKADGVFIFTVPWLSKRPTVVRAAITADGMVEHLQKASFHGEYDRGLEDYLVFYEFGYDFIEELKDLFKVEIYCHDGFGGPVSSVFVCHKCNG